MHSAGFKELKKSLQIFLYNLLLSQEGKKLPLKWLLQSKPSSWLINRCPPTYQKHVFSEAYIQTTVTSISINPINQISAARHLLKIKTFCICSNVYVFLVSDRGPLT